MMISPHKKPGGGAPASPRTAVPLRGLLLDGIWRCNCPERPPARKVQTKNHGVNHGRWFYTCDKDHQHRCKFFLWANDAEAREKLVLLSNSRSEASSTPRTPSKTSTTSAQQGTGLLTPQTGHRNTHTPSEAKRVRKTPAHPQSQTSLSIAKARMMSEDTDEFEWDDAIDAEMEKIADSSQPRPPLRQPDFGLPRRKTPHTEGVTSPGMWKRSSDQEGEEERSVTPTPRPVPFLTPTPTRYKNAVVGIGESPLASSDDLAAQVSRVLEGHGVSVPKAAHEELREVFGRHELKMKGVIRGRDISRIALRKKDEQIARLNERIATLESQRELERSVRGGYKGK